eukprot:3338564-Pyramimonas_sp.AAC.1
MGALPSGPAEVTFAPPKPEMRERRPKPRPGPEGPPRRGRWRRGLAARRLPASPIGAKPKLVD